jgi:signal transduction histidine kinase
MEGCLAGQELERMRLGRELHDSTGQLLISLHLIIARLKLSPIDPDVALQEIDDAVRAIEREIRATTWLCHPPCLSADGLIATLHRLCREFGNRTGIPTTFSDRSGGGLAQGPTALALLRIAQEALTNIYRHARAESASLALDREGDWIALTIRDDGCGLPQGNLHPGVGLQSMEHRLASLGGELQVQRLIQGTQLVARLPAGRGVASLPDDRRVLDGRCG